MRLCHSLRPAAALLMVLLIPQTSHALLGFLKKKEPVAPETAERATMEREAQQILDQARAAQSAGNLSKAKSLYASLTRQYPFSRAAGEAAYTKALLLKESGASLQSSFDAFQEFIERHRSSPRFEDAIRQQFEIAEMAKGGRKERSLILIRFKLGGDTVAGMFEKIIQNAPYGKLAPLAQFNIGEVYQDSGDKEKSVAAYQLTVENYPNTKQADEAQFRIGSINSVAAKRSEDKSNLTAARDALTTYVEINPTGQRSAEAKRGLQQINAVEATQSLSVAKFYVRMGKPKAAAIYLNEALRYGDSAISQEARQLLSSLAADEPQAVAEVRKKQPDQDYTLEGDKNLKGRDDFVGPSLPELKELTRKPAMRAGNDKFLPLPGTDPLIPGSAKPANTAPGGLLPLPADGTKPPQAVPALPVPPKPKQD